VYLAVDTDGTAYVVAHRSEMGNGVRTSLPRIVADELDADWARVKVVQATGDEKYGDQDTDGSHSVVSFFVPLREAGASARLMLVRAAAAKWNVPMEECSTELHAVVHKRTGKRAGYGELASAAPQLEVPKKEELKPTVLFQALGGVAVIADNTWSAMQGKKKLKVEWEKNEHSDYNSGEYKKYLVETARKPGKVVREVGNVDTAFGKGGKVVEAEY